MVVGAAVRPTGQQETTIMHTTETWTGTFNVVLDDENTFANRNDNPDMPHDYIDQASGVYCYRSRESAQTAIDAVRKDVVTVIIDGQTKVQGSTPESIARGHFGEKATLRIVADNEIIIAWIVVKELPNNSSNYSAEIIGTMYMYKTHTRNRIPDLYPRLKVADRGHDQ